MQSRGEELHLVAKESYKLGESLLAITMNTVISKYPTILVILTSF